MMKNNELFNSDEYLDDNDGGYMLEDLDYLLSETIVEPRGEITGWMFLSERSSRYGPIGNHGEIGYKKVDNPVLADAILSETSSDSFTVEIDEGILKVDYHDHDGTHSCTVKPIVKSRVEAIERKLNSFGELIEYIKTMPSVKAK